jgi:hypothetical protein
LCKTRSASTAIIKGKKVRVDTCFKPLIEYLNEVGFETIFCCCGHNRYTPTILYKGSDGVYEFLSDTKVNGNKHFYEKDSEGFFYIPQLEKAIQRFQK